LRRFLDFRGPPVCSIGEKLWECGTSAEFSGFEHHFARLENQAKAIGSAFEKSEGEPVLFRHGICSMPEHQPLHQQGGSPDRHGQ
jgi:hypothetical protein